MEANPGDTIYIGGKFAKILNRFTDGYYELDLRIQGKRFWIINSPIIVLPDTPENRFIIQLKYS